MNYLIKNVSSKEELEKTYNFYKMIFKDMPFVDLDNPEYSLEKWEERMKNHGELCLELPKPDKDLQKEY